MARVPELSDRDALTPEQQAVFDAIRASRGRVVGPWPVLLHSPGAASSAQELGGYLRFGSPLDSGLRECVLAYTALLLDCDLEWLAHRRLGLRAGVDPDIFEKLEARNPGKIGGDIGLAVTIADALVREHRVPVDLFERARQRWDTRALVDLTATIGYVSFVAAIINAFEIEPLTS